MTSLMNLLMASLMASSMNLLMKKMMYALDLFLLSQKNVSSADYQTLRHA